MGRIYTKTSRYGWSKQQTDKLLLLGVPGSFIASTISAIAPDQLDTAIRLLSDKDLDTENLISSVGLTAHKLRLSAKAYAEFVLFASANPGAAEELSYTLNRPTLDIPETLWDSELCAFVEWMYATNQAIPNLNGAGQLHLLTELYRAAINGNQASQKDDAAISERLRRARELATTICKRTTKLNRLTNVIAHAECAIPWSNPDYDELYTAMLRHITVRTGEFREPRAQHHYTILGESRRLQELYGTLSEPEKELFILLYSTTNISPKEAATGVRSLVIDREPTT